MEDEEGGPALLQLPVGLLDDVVRQVLVDNGKRGLEETTSSETSAESDIGVALAGGSSGESEGGGESPKRRRRSTFWISG